MLKRAVLEAAVAITWRPVGFLRGCRNLGAAEIAMIAGTNAARILDIDASTAARA